MPIVTQQSGFTLIELLVVMSLLAILLVIGAPNLSDYNANNRINGAAQEFQGIIQLARTEAITSNSIVNLDSGNGDNWSGNISVCRAAGIAADTAAIPPITAVAASATNCTAGGTTLLKTYNLGTNGVVINSNGTGAPLISFNSQGRLAEGAGNTVTLAFCDDRGGGDYRLITISVTGRPRISDLGVGTCTP